MHATDEGRGGLLECPFSYHESGSGKIFIHWRGSQVMILNGDRAKSFLDRLSRLDDAGKQAVMAKTTGNFKRGNER